MKAGMPMKVLTICLTALILPLQLAWSSTQQSSVSTSTAVSAYQLLDALIETLARSSSALDDVNARSQATLVDRMTSVQNAKIELDVVKRYIQPFSSAENENTAAAIAGTLGAYTAMQKSLAMTLALYEKLDAAKSEEDLVGMRRQISDAKVLYQQSSKMLIEATTLAFASIVVPDPKDPKDHVALPITAEQKLQLLGKLRSRFGSRLSSKKEEDDTGPLQAARVLFNALGKDWRLAGS
jgi:hypothetical protein